MSQIDQVLTPTTHDLGQFQVRRVLPAKARSMVGPFIVDQFGPAQLDLGGGMDVRPKTAYQSTATVTWLFEGAIDHRDSIGTLLDHSAGTGEPDDCGRGIVFVDRPAGRATRGSEALRHADLARSCPTGAKRSIPAFEAVKILPIVEDGRRNDRDHG